MSPTPAFIKKAMSLGLRAGVMAGLGAVFLVMVYNGLSRDARPEPSRAGQPAATATPLPTAALPPSPTLKPTPVPSQAELCIAPDSSQDVAEALIYGSWGEIIGLVYCDRGDLRYITYVDLDGQVERTYLFEDGVVRVKLYHSNGSVVKREDFDAEGNPVPDGTYVDLPNNRIGPRSGVHWPWQEATPGSSP